jgi:hypothetical protein
MQLRTENIEVEVLRPLVRMCTALASLTLGSPAFVALWRGIAAAVLDELHARRVGQVRDPQIDLGVEALTPGEAHVVASTLRCWAVAARRRHGDFAADLVAIAEAVEAFTSPAPPQGGRM